MTPRHARRGNPDDPGDADAGAGGGELRTDTMISRSAPMDVIESRPGIQSRSPTAAACPARRATSSIVTLSTTRIVPSRSPTVTTCRRDLPLRPWGSPRLAQEGHGRLIEAQRVDPGQRPCVAHRSTSCRWPRSWPAVDVADVRARPDDVPVGERTNRRVATVRIGSILQPDEEHVGAARDTSA